MTALVLADSRGRGLQELLAKLKPTFAIHVLTYPGAGSELAALKAVPHIKKLSPSLVIVLSGICDLTWRNKSTKIVGLRHSTLADNVDHVMEAIRASYDVLKSQGVPLISFATITGADLADCNNPDRRQMNAVQYLEHCSCSKTIHPDQVTLNNSILTINKKIVIFNRKNSARTTWLAGLVHSYYKGKYHHCYIRLADGCHPDAKTKEAWAAQLIKSALRIAPALCLLPPPDQPSTKC